MPAVPSWRKQYSSRGLRVIAVHLPRTPGHWDLDCVKAAIEHHEITGPCALDNDGVLAERFGTGEVWPYCFFFDAEGKLRSRAAGGMGLRLLENALKRYLAVRASAAAG